MPNILVHDPHVDTAEAKHKYGVDLVELDKFKDVTAVIIAVAHEEFKYLLLNQLKNMLNGIKLVVDVKSQCAKETYEKYGITVLRV